MQTALIPEKEKHIELMPHNAKTLQEVETFISKHQHCCVVNPCGSGKTSIMAAIIENHMDATFTILTKQRNAAGYYRNRSPLFCGSNINIVTYNRMAMDFKTGNTDKYNSDYYLVDEAHYLGAPTWRQAFEYLSENYDPLLIGFTATPQRYEDQGTGNNIVKTFFLSNAAGNYTSKDLEGKGVFVQPEYVLSVYNMPAIIDRNRDKVSLLDIPEDRQNNYFRKLDELERVWNRKSSPEKILAEYLPKFMYKDHCNRILVYVSDYNSLPERKFEIDYFIQNIFPWKRVKSYVYTYRDPEDNLKGFLREDNTYIKILYSIDKIMETIHIDDLRIAIMLRPSTSNRIITQQFGRINSIANRNRPLIIDMVDNLTNLSAEEKERKERSGKREKHQEVKSEDRKGSKVLPRLPHIAKYADVFADIDRATRSVKYLTYKGVTGTLVELCTIFGVQKKDLPETVTQDNIADIFENVPRRRPQKFTVEVENFELTEEQRAYAERHIYFVEDFIKSRGIKDEDLCQDLRLEYFRTISKVQIGTVFPYQINQKILQAVSRMYASFMRIKVSYNETFMNDISSVYAFTKETPEDLYVKSEGEQLVCDTINMLEDRQSCVLRRRYYFESGREETLEEISADFGVTRERVRQIEAKALRIMRAPNRSRPIREYIEDLYDQGTNTYVRYEGKEQNCGMYL